MIMTYILQVKTIFFSLTKYNALISCGGKSQIFENEGEEIIKIEINDSNKWGQNFSNSHFRDK